MLLELATPDISYHYTTSYTCRIAEYGRSSARQYTLQQCRVALVYCELIRRVTTYVTRHFAKVHASKNDKSARSKYARQWARQRRWQAQSRYDAGLLQLTWKAMLPHWAGRFRCDADHGHFREEGQADDNSQ